MSAPEEAPVPGAAPVEKKSMSPVMMIGIGAGVFVAQAVLVYLLIVFVLVPKFGGGGAHGAQAETEKTVEAEGGEGAVTGQFVFVVKDMIINPAGTGGTRFLLTTVGVETSSEEHLKSIEKKDVVVRDVLNTVLASKTVEALDDQTLRDGLRREIKDSLQKYIKPEKVSQVYFSKFIIQ